MKEDMPPHAIEKPDFTEELLVQPFAIDELSPVMRLRRAEEQARVASSDFVAVGRWSSNVNSLVQFAEADFPEFFIANTVELTKKRMVEAYSAASDHHKEIINNHCCRYFNERKVDSSQIEAGDISAISQLSDEEYIDFAVWHLQDLSQTEIAFKEKLPGFLEDFKLSWERMSQLNPSIPRLANKLIAERLDSLHFRAVDVFDALGQERALAGFYNAYGNVIGIGSEVLKSEAAAKKVFFHEMIHALSGQAHVYKFEIVKYNDSEADSTAFQDRYMEREHELRVLSKHVGRHTLTSALEGGESLYPSATAQRVGLSKMYRYDWLNEAVTEHLTQMLLSQSVENPDGVLKFTAQDMRGACEKGSYNDERAFVSKLLGFSGRSRFTNSINMVQSDRLVSSALKAFFENYRPGNKRPGRGQLNLHKTFNDFYGKGILPIIDRYINEFGIVKAYDQIARYSELKFISSIFSSRRQEHSISLAGKLREELKNKT